MRRKKRPAKPIKEKRRVLDIGDYIKFNSYEYGERNYILYIIGITTGYRAGDLVTLKVRDIKEALRKGEFEIYESKKMNSKNIREKNRKPRVVELIPELGIQLKKYIKDKKDYEYMFPSRKGQGKEHLGVPAVSRLLKEAGEYFNLYDISAHSMRKTYAYKIYLESGCDIVAVKELLGHSSIEETKLYLDLDREKYHQYNKSLGDFIR